MINKLHYLKNNIELKLFYHFNIFCIFRTNIELSTVLFTPT